MQRSTRAAPLASPAPRATVLGARRRQPWRGRQRRHGLRPGQRVARGQGQAARRACARSLLLPESLPVAARFQVAAALALLSAALFAASNAPKGYFAARWEQFLRTRQGAAVAGLLRVVRRALVAALARAFAPLRPFLQKLGADLRALDLGPEQDDHAVAGGKEEAPPASPQAKKAARLTKKADQLQRIVLGLAAAGSAAGSAAGEEGAAASETDTVATTRDLDEASEDAAGSSPARAVTATPCEGKGGGGGDADAAGVADAVGSRSREAGSAGAAADSLPAGANGEVAADGGASGSSDDTPAEDAGDSAEFGRRPGSPQPRQTRKHSERPSFFRDVRDDILS